MNTLCSLLVFCSGLYTTSALNLASAECTYAEIHIGELWTWLFFFSLRLSQSMEGARKKHLQAWSCYIESQNECQRADWAWRKSWCPLISFDSSVRHAHFWVSHLNTFLLCETHRWVSVASVLRQPQWSEVRWLGNPEASWHTDTEVPSAFQKSIQSGQKELKVVKTF